MVRTDPRLERRIQLRQGLLWLAAAQRDPYAALLRGLDTDPGTHWRMLAGQPLVRSATGDWVTARHSVALAVRDEPALRAHPWLEGTDGPVSDGPVSDGPVSDGPVSDGPVSDGPVSDGPAPKEGDDLWPAEVAWDRAAAAPAPDGALDVVALARSAATGTLAQRWGLDESGERALAEASARTADVLDDRFHPLPPAEARRLAGGMAALRALPVIGTSDERLLLATAGVAMTAGLVTGALVEHHAATADLEGLWARLRERPRYAVPVVTETLRRASPVQLHAAVAEGPCEIARSRIEVGDRVVVLVGAANHDPEVFTAPEQFDPDRPPAETAAVLPPGLRPGPVLSFAEACARAGLLRLARLRPGPAPAGAVVRRRAAPVSRAVLTYPATTP